MSKPRWILEPAVLAIHSMLLTEHGGPSGIRDSNLLASALNRPRDKFAYEPNCSLHELASAYSFGIVSNHPFVDGNKRTGFLCGSLFLELNGYEFKASEPDAALMFESLASGNISEPELTAWFKLYSEKL